MTVGISARVGERLVAGDGQGGVPGPMAKPSRIGRPAGTRLDFHTRYSIHGYGMDVRHTYGHLPFQPFWTWLTGKSLWPHPPRRPQQTWLREWQLWAQILWAYLIVVGSVVAASLALNSGIPSWQCWPVYVSCWVLVVNRTRGLLHTFHYTNHGATIANMDRAKWIATYFMSIPILHTCWEKYKELHARDHHGAASLCTSTDPDQQFMEQHGFRLGMSEAEFWTRLVLAPLIPRNVWAHLWFRISENFITPSLKEVIPRIMYWFVFVAVVTYSSLWTEISIFFLFPLLFLTQISSWIQHTTEHLWFPVVEEKTSMHVHIGAMTWGRFLGRPYPARGVSQRAFKLGYWWAAAIMLDLPMRLFSFMQDLPSHDFHHRSPRVNFWSIAQERRAHEGRPSKYGPMTETWGIVESWLILRDHLCRGRHDPFLIFAWERNEGALSAECQTDG